jgi:hypothetical protein
MSVSAGYSGEKIADKLFKSGELLPIFHRDMDPAQTLVFGC